MCHLTPLKPCNGLLGLLQGERQALGGIVDPVSGKLKIEGLDSVAHLVNAICKHGVTLCAFPTLDAVKFFLADFFNVNFLSRVVEIVCEISVFHSLLCCPVWALLRVLVQCVTLHP